MLLKSKIDLLNLGLHCKSAETRENNVSRIKFVIKKESANFTNKNTCISND